MRENAALKIHTLGNFQVWREGHLITPKEWGRDKTVQLFQFFITSRHRKALHKEQIFDRLWEDLDLKSAESTFKVALHGINKTLEPNRKSRTEARYLIRQGITYQLNLNEIWLDALALEEYIKIGNQALVNNPSTAIQAYQEAVELYDGIYLPNRLYEDWSSAERERLQLLVLSTFIALGELLLEQNPTESLRLAQEALLIDNTSEEAYRLQMQACLQKGNRPLAIKTYRQCVKILDDEFGVSPLPETQQLYKQIENL